MRKLAVFLVTFLIGMTFAASPVEAVKDSGWGCGGACRSYP